MRFRYYTALSRKDRTLYDASDAITAVRLPQPEELRPWVTAIQAALQADDRLGVETSARRLVEGLMRQVAVEPVSVAVLAIRPRLEGAELHGLYTWGDAHGPRIRVWMRTVRFKRVVAFRTFLRTLLHEACHHLDVTLFGFPQSFHTEGFFKRESSLFYQLLPKVEGRAPRRRAPPGQRGESA